MKIAQAALTVLGLLSVAAASASAGVVKLRLEDVTAGIWEESEVTGTAYVVPGDGYEILPTFNPVGLFEVGFTSYGGSVWDNGIWDFHLHIEVTNTDSVARTLNIQFTATDLGPVTGGNLSSGIGGVVFDAAGTTVSFSEAIDPSNQPYGMPGNPNSYSSPTIIPAIDGDFSHAQVRMPSGVAGGQFSLTHNITIYNLAPGATVSFDSSSMIPEPGSAPVIGIAFVVIAGLVLRPGAGKHNEIPEEYLATVTASAS